MKFPVILENPGRFLMLGHCRPELEDLIKAKWKGLAIVPTGTWGANSLTDDEYYGDVTYIEANLSNDPHFSRLMQGYWVKPLTVRDIFDQYGGEKFDLIMIDVPMLTRLLWYSEQVQVHMPKFHVIREDGHNEAVRVKAAELGYAVRDLEGDWLLMAR